MRIQAFGIAALGIALVIFPAAGFAKGGENGGGGGTGGSHFSSGGGSGSNTPYLGGHGGWGGNVNQKPMPVMPAARAVRRAGAVGAAERRRLSRSLVKM